jgi:hypothetical protein
LARKGYYVLIMPLDPISIAVEAALKKMLIDIPVDLLAKRLLTELNPQLTKVQDKIDLVQLGLEKDRIAELKTALSFVKYGNNDRAFEALVRAEVLNDISPLAKTLLASFLLQRGKIEEATSKLGEAAKLNPYLLAPVLVKESLNPAGITEIDGQPWTLRLWDQAFISQLSKGWPRKLLQRYFGFYSTRSTAAIYFASLCWNNLVVHWILGDNLRHKGYEQVIMAVDTKDGTIRWRHRNIGWTPVFATYNHIIGFDQEYYFFVSWQTGKKDRSTQMSPEYFSLMYLGDQNLQELPAFKRSTWSGTAAAEAYEKSADFLEPRIQSADPTLGHLPKLFLERAVLSDPYGFKVPEVRVENKWEHFHFNGGSGSMFPSCRLIGGAKIERYQQNSTLLMVT